MTKIPAAECQRLTSLIQDRLAVLRNELRSSLHQAESPDVRALANHFEETGDAALADLEASTAIAGLQRDIGEFNALHAALARLTAGSYGTCAECGTQIPLARLQIRPEAERCLGCQTTLEAAQDAHPSSL